MEWGNALVVIACGLLAAACLLIALSLRRQAEATCLLQDLMRRQADVVRAERQAAESIEQIAELTVSEARRLVEERAAERSAAYIAHVASTAEREANAQATSRAHWILASALAGVAQAPDRISYKSVVALPDVQGLRPRLLGRHGSNLAAFAELTGVQLSLHDQRLQAVLTAYDPERRAIAEEVLKILIDEPRIYASTIRQAYSTVAGRWPSYLIGVGREAGEAADVGDLSDEAAGLMGRLRFHRIDGVSALSQAVTGARIAAVLSAEVGWSSPHSVVRAAFLRDLGYATGNDRSGHSEAGAIVAARLGESDAICQAIRQHHDFTVSHGDVASALVACAERLTVAGTEKPYEAPWLGALRLRDLEKEVEGLSGVSRARVLGLASEVSVWVDPEVVPDDALQDLTVQAAKVAQQRSAKPITVTVHRHRAWQAPPNADAAPLRWLTDPDEPPMMKS